MFNWAKINFLGFWILTARNALGTDPHATGWSSCQLKTFVNTSQNDLDNISLPFLLRWSLLLFRWCCFITSLWLIILMFFVVHNLLRCLFTIVAFSSSSSFLWMIFDIITSCDSFFKFAATSTIDFAIRSGVLSVAKSLVPTWSINWSGLRTTRESL